MSVTAPTLAGSLRGELIDPDNAGYDDARRLYNAMIDKRPALIARCVDVSDVIACVRYAADHGVDLAIRGGGHNGGGLGSVDGGLVIDLSELRGVRVDPHARTVTVAGGTTLGEVDHATHAFGLAVPAGIISSTGVGGLTLGGGIGHLTRAYGLTIDNLIGADVVLADGSLVRASESEHEDLFWALRGGGGNFGVVTSFTFQARPVSTVVAGPMLWPLDQAAEVLAFYTEFMAAAPEQLNGFFAFLTVPAGAAVPGGAAPAEDVRRRLVLRRSGGGGGGGARAGAEGVPARARRRGRGAAAGDAVRLRRSVSARRPVVLARRLRRDDPGGRDRGARRARARAADVEVDDAPLSGRRRRRPRRTRRDGVGLPQRALGAGDRRRRSRSGQGGATCATGPSATGRRCTRTRAGGAYSNFLMDEGDDRVRASYGDNYDRLARVKTAYDPGNLFHVNQNIKPS